IIPVINKIDLASADIDGSKAEIEDIIGLDTEGCPLISAKEGIGIEDVLAAVIEKLPAPKGDENAPLKCLIFDSFYDNYRGAISMVRVKDGTVKAGDKIRMMSTGKEFEVVEVGVFTPDMKPVAELKAGEVGYIGASIKNVSDTAVGDTITNAETPAKEPLPGYKKATPMVFTGVFPADGARYNDLKEALLKLQLNDASLSFEPEVSVALGFGFRCGFLGLLHMEIIEERLEREFDLDLITTAPSVEYRVTKTDGEVLTVANPTNLPNPSEIDYIEEPIVKALVYTPPEYVGSIMELCQDKRGVFIDMTYVEQTRVQLTYTIPLNEIIYDFFDKLKSRTRGYASLDYEMDGYQKSDLIRLDMLINGDMCDALSLIVHKDKAYA
ncbi:MAG: translation elongation factor 4, partial [Clostridia bacterium]|nr:translation elongation factor 4 [Clostridia bacterium]